MFGLKQVTNKLCVRDATLRDTPAHGFQAGEMFLSVRSVGCGR